MKDIANCPLTVLSLAHFEDFEKSLGGHSIQPTVLERAPVSGRIVALNSNNLSMRFGHLKGSLLLTSRTVEKKVTLGTLVRGKGAKTCSAEVSPGNVIIYPASYEHQSVYHEMTEYMAVCCDIDTVLDFAKSEGVNLLESDFQHGNIHPQPPAEAAIFRANIQRIGQVLINKPSVREDPNAMRGLTDDLMRMFVRSLGNTALSENRNGDNFDSYTCISAKAEDWLASRMANPHSMADLSKGIGLSLRQLYRAFQSELGVSPAQYLIRI